jgi:large subunit ribosomal protein L15
MRDDRTAHRPLGIAHILTFIGPLVWAVLILFHPLPGGDSAYEGGQTPIHMRMGKLRGPHHKMSMPFEKFRTRTQPVNVADLDDRFKAGDEVTPESLREKGLAKRRWPVKVLGRGEISTKLTVKAHGFSASAKEKIEGAGGTCEELD